MPVTIADWIVGAFVAALGVVGLFLAAGAVDGMIELFGLGLAAFAVLFNFQLVRRHFDAAEGRG